MKTILAAIEDVARSLRLPLADAVRDILLAEETGAHIHIAHISTRGAIEAVRRAKNEGINVTCEVTPRTSGSGSPTINEW